MSGICPKMNGAQCGMEYCEFWNDDELACSIALESRKRVELLNLLIEKAEELIGDAKSKEDLIKTINELNIVSPIKTLQ
jgi:hypothetical protein